MHHPIMHPFIIQYTYIRVQVNIPRQPIHPTITQSSIHPSSNALISGVGMYHSRHHIFILRTAAIIIGLFPSGSEKPSLFTPFLNNSKLLPTESNVIKVVQIILIVPITTELVQLNAIFYDKNMIFFTTSCKGTLMRKERASSFVNVKTM